MNKPTLGIYAGSFNPFHIGHLDVLKQSLEVFDKVMVAKCNNPSKKEVDKYPLPETFLYNLKRVYVKQWDGLLVDLIKSWETHCNVTVVRGLRCGADLEYEQNFSAFLRSMYPSVKIVAFYCNPNFRHISSSTLRSIENISPEEYRKYIVED